jgi:hypothetical protein
MTKKKGSLLNLTEFNMAVPELYIKIKGLKSVLADWFIGGWVGLHIGLPSKFTTACCGTWVYNPTKDRLELELPSGLCEQRLFHIRLALRELEILGFAEVGTFVLKGEESLVLPEEHEYSRAFEVLKYTMNNVAERKGAFL